MAVAQMGTGRAIIAATLIVIKSPPLCPCDNSLYPLVVHILPSSLPFFGRLFVPYLPRISLGFPEHSSDLSS